LTDYQTVLITAALLTDL